MGSIPRQPSVPWQDVRACEFEGLGVMRTTREHCLVEVSPNDLWIRSVLQLELRLQSEQEILEGPVGLILDSSTTLRAGEVDSVFDRRTGVLIEQRMLLDCDVRILQEGLFEGDETWTTTTTRIESSLVREAVR